MTLSPQQRQDIETIISSSLRTLQMQLAYTEGRHHNTLGAAVEHYLARLSAPLDDEQLVVLNARVVALFHRVEGSLGKVGEGVSRFESEATTLATDLKQLS